MGKLNNMIVAAYRKGYRVQDNKLFSFTGKVLSLCKNNSGYFKAWCVIGDLATSLYVHKLAAYQKYGDLIFLPGMTVRHLDGDSSNNYLSNIAIGTMSENKLDMSYEKRYLAALAGNRESVKYTRKYPDFVVECILSDRKSGYTYKDLCHKYQIPKSTLSWMLNKSKYAFKFKN